MLLVQSGGAVKTTVAEPERGPPHPEEEESLNEPVCEERAEPAAKTAFEAQDRFCGKVDHVGD